MKKFILSILILLIAVPGVAQYGQLGGGITGLTFDGTNIVAGAPADSFIFEIPISAEASITITTLIGTSFKIFNTAGDSMIFNPNGFSSANSAVAGTAVFNYKSRGGHSVVIDSLSAYISVYDSPVSNVALMQLGTSVDADRFKVDEDGDVTADGSIAAGGALSGTTITGTGLISTTVTTKQLELKYDGTNTFDITLLDDGHTTFTTVDPDGVEADINFNPDGNVGIKTAAPSTALEVTGRVTASTGFTDGTFTVDGSGVFTGVGTFTFGNGAILNNTDANNLVVTEANIDFDGAVTASTLTSDAGIIGTSVFPAVTNVGTIGDATTIWNTGTSGTWTLGDDSDNVSGKLFVVGADNDLGDIGITADDALLISGFTGAVVLHPDGATQVTRIGSGAFEVHTDGAGHIVNSRAQSNNNPNTWATFKAAGSHASKTAVNLNHGIGDFAFYPYDGDEYVYAASIMVSMDGGVSNNDTPTKITFRTTLDGTKVLEEHLRIDNAGDVRITKQPDGTAIVNGTDLMILNGFGDDDTADSDEIAFQILVEATGTWTDGAEDAKATFMVADDGVLNANQLVLDTDAGVYAGTNGNEENYLNVEIFNDSTVTGETTWSSVLPAGYIIESIIFKNTTANEITNLDIGFSDAGGEVVAAANLLASDEGSFTLLQRVDDFDAADTLFISAANWNSANLIIYIRMVRIF